MHATPKDETTRRAVLIFNTAVVVLDAKTGTPVAPPVFAGMYPAMAAVVDARDNRVFVLGQASSASGNAIGPGRVTMLDARRASVMRTVAVEQNPRTMTFDERRGRVLILSSGPVTRQDRPAGGYIDVPMAVVA